MDMIDTVISNVRTAAKTHGLAALAREADVPYTSLKSFSDRGWTNKHLLLLQRLDTAAHRLTSGPAT
ncbi:hypothetical protein ACFPIF_15720 [Brevundimonas faecalis]|uniref:hypothetical protein n=1 Tax=Brevundimonas faecalis TaxID=947378 RepID=UPI00361B70A9